MMTSQDEFYTVSGLVDKYFSAQYWVDDNLKSNELFLEPIILETCQIANAAALFRV